MFPLRRFNGEVFVNLNLPTADLGPLNFQANGDFRVLTRAWRRRQEVRYDYLDDIAIRREAGSRFLFVSIGPEQFLFEYRRSRLGLWGYWIRWTPLASTPDGGMATDQLPTWREYLKLWPAEVMTSLTLGNLSS